MDIIFSDKYKEVSPGDLACDGDKIFTPDGLVITLSHTDSILHNQFEPEGYNIDSFKRYRKNIA